MRASSAFAWGLETLKHRRVRQLSLQPSKVVSIYSSEVNLHITRAQGKFTMTTLGN